MEISDTLTPSVEMSTIVIVKNRCQFCYAFFKDPAKSSEHSNRCAFRFTETFETFDGKSKFACAVCFDVFQTRVEHAKHEQLHKFPGGFPCSMCDELFLNEQECGQHMEKIHEMFRCPICEDEKYFDAEHSLIEHMDYGHGIVDSRYTACSKCGAYFEQKTYLRLHAETKCDQHRNEPEEKILEINGAFKIENEENSLQDIQDMPVFSNLEVESINLPSMGNETDPMEPKDSLSGSTAANGNDETNTSDDGSLDRNEIENTVVDDSIEYLDEENPILRKEEVDNEKEDNFDAIEDYDDSDSAESISNEREQKTLECNICNAKYELKRSFDEHIKLHGSAGNLIHKCTRCRLFFSTVAEMNTHRINTHQVTLECKKCEKSFTSRSGLWQHNRSAHKKENAEAVQESNELKEVDSSESESDSDDEPKAKEKRQKCPYCDKLFSTKHELFEHNEALHANEYHECELCGLTFRHIWVHMRRHTNKKTFTCEYCDRVFIYRHGLVKHLSVHTGVKPYECITCKEGFLTRTDLKGHQCAGPPSCDYTISLSILNEISGEIIEDVNAEREPEQKKIKLNVPKSTTLLDKKFACKYCHMKYTREIYLTKHISVHGPDGRLVHRCECCLTYFASKEEVKTHKMSLHKAELTCQICSRVFGFLDNLQMHHRNKHSNAVRNKHMCTKCGKSFVNKTTLGLHEQSDCGASPQCICQECGKVLSNKYTLQTHQRSHAEPKNIPCPTCGKLFRAKHSLIIHLRTHTGERPFICDQCNKGFMDQNSLNLHMSIHTGFRRYICRNCGARFSCHSNLRAHRRVRKNTCGLVPMTDSLIKINPT